MSLRKVNIVATALTDKAASFTNVTSQKLHIRKIVLSGNTVGTITSADDWIASIDEESTTQFGQNDSRSHVIGGRVKAGSTGADADLSKLISFNRGDLVLDTDEALFLNLTDVAGTPSVSVSVNVWYEAV